ncbi:MAG: preprotein translocase subunit SecE [Myxococcales bacterium]|nr:preprotein translocase subunit SecE [Myxococcales bacterium]
MSENPKDDENDREPSNEGDDEPSKEGGVVDATFEDSEEGSTDEATKEASGSADTASDEEEDDEDDAIPTQMGHRRYVYATFFAFAIALTYFLGKAGFAVWHRLSQMTPKVGEPREDWMTPLAAVISALAMFLVYRRPDVRQLSDEVALELSKVEWPTREKVRRSTIIVVSATLGSSLVFWLYDIGANRGISFVTGSDHPLLYGLGAGVFIYAIRALGSRYLAGKA